MNITTRTGCMLKNNANDELLPITGLEFEEGGAISGINTLEDGNIAYHDAAVLEAKFSIAFISCNRWSDLVECPLCDGERDVVIDDEKAKCIACKGVGRVTSEHKNLIKAAIEDY